MPPSKPSAGHSHQARATSNLINRSLTVSDALSDAVWGISPAAAPARHAHVRISDLTLDPELQPRCRLNQDVVSQYARHMLDQGRDADTFPPVAVFATEQQPLLLADGFHRIAARQSLGWRVIHAAIRQGTREQAIWYSRAFNARHGLHFTRADMERSIRTLLRIGPGSSDRFIAAQLGCDHKTVGSCRRTMFGPQNPSASPDRVAVAQGRSARWHPSDAERKAAMRQLTEALDRAALVNFGDVLIAVADWWRARNPRCRVTFETHGLPKQGPHASFLPRVPGRNFPMRRPGSGLDRQYCRQAARREAVSAALERELGPFDAHQRIAVIRALEADGR
jgi:hypothetical protein